MDKELSAKSLSDLDQAANAIEAGRVKEGRHLLLTVLDRDPTNVLAWLWMTKTVEEPGKKLMLFRRILEIDPGNQHAIKGLSWYEPLVQRKTQQKNGPDSGRHIAVSPARQGPDSPRASSTNAKAKTAPLSSTPTSAEASPADSTTSNTTSCKSCGETVAKAAPACPHCGEVAPGLKIPCPNCGSLRFRTDQQGFKLKDAAVGALIVGPVGLLGGLLYRNNLELRCVQCGHVLKPKPGDLNL